MVRDSQHLYTRRHWAISSGLPLQIHVKPSNLLYQFDIFKDKIILLHQEDPGYFTYLISSIIR